MQPQDPSYPLYPIASILCSAALALILCTNFIRRSWNTGLSLLCIYLCVENLFSGVSAILWADNWDVKIPVYCDIGILYSMIFHFGVELIFAY